MRIRFPGFLVSWFAETKKSAPHFQRSAFCQTANSLIDCDKVRIALADHALRIDKSVHVNRHPATVHEHEVRVPDQPEMVLSISLDEEVFRMPPKAEHIAVTRSELLLVHGRRLTGAPNVRRTRGSDVGLARAGARAGSGAHTSFMSVHVRAVTLHVRLTTHGRTRVRPY